MWQWVAVMALAVNTETAAAPQGPRLHLRANSWAQEQWYLSTAPTKVWSSRVRRGKSWGAWMDALYKCLAIPGFQAAYARLEFQSMRESSLKTLQRMIGAKLFDEWWHEAGSEAHKLLLPPVLCDDGVTRQSSIVCFGLLKPGRILSTEYGLIILEQAEQMEREHRAMVDTRLNFFDPWQEARAKELGIQPRQLGIICNADDPEHWINLDYEIEARGMGTRKDPDTGAEFEVILSQASDNEENLTDDYRARLEGLRGTVWYDRLVGGRWVRAEGLVFGHEWQPAVHIINRPESWDKWRIQSGLEAGKIIPPPNLTRHRWMDFGVNHPFTCTWGAELPDRTVIAYREISGTGKAPSQWAEQINALEAAEVEAWRAGIEDEDEARVWRPYLSGFHCASSISDTDLGWRTELDRCGVWTRVIDKNAGDGIEGRIGVIKSALRENQIKFVSDLLVEPDPELRRQKLPTSIFQEMGRYKWRSRPASSSEAGEGRFDVPVDRDNHRIDPLGYFLSDYRGGPGPGRVW